MCERDSSDDILRSNEFTRRQFGTTGYCMGGPIGNHNAGAAETGWARKLELFKKALA